MNRPAVLRQLEGRVTGRAVTPYRVRAPDVVRLVEYVRHLEGRTKVRPARAGTPLDADERMLGDECRVTEGCGLREGHAAVCRLVKDDRDEPETPPSVTDVLPVREHHPACMWATDKPDHAGVCPIPSPRRTKSA